MWYITNKQKNEVIDTENILVVARGKGWVMGKTGEAG